MDTDAKQVLARKKRIAESIVNLEGVYQSNRANNELGERDVINKWKKWVLQWTADYEIPKYEIVQLLLESKPKSARMDFSTFGFAQPKTTKPRASSKNGQLNWGDMVKIFRKADNLYSKELEPCEVRVLFYLEWQATTKDGEIISECSARTFEKRYKNASKKTYQKGISGLIEKGIIKYKSRGKAATTKSVFVLFPNITPYSTGGRYRTP